MLLHIYAALTYLSVYVSLTAKEKPLMEIDIKYLATKTVFNIEVVY